MQVKKIPFRQTHSFSSLFIDYIERHQNTTSLYNRFPELAGVKDQIQEKQQFPSSSRELLVSRLKVQYKDIPTHKAVEINIDKLKDPTTFTITTGHQLNLLMGPIYVVYKILTVINISQKLSKQYPQHHFVPVFWMASEDHDVDEIRTVQIQGKPYTWATDQTGPVGRFSLHDMDNIWEELTTFDISIFLQAYKNSHTLSEAVRKYLHTFFGSFGLVVVDADDREWKRLFLPVIKADLHQSISKQCVDKAHAEIKRKGYTTQVNARNINLFYMAKNMRARIEFMHDHYQVVGTPLTFSPQDMDRMLESEPEKFSPNVLLRPLYQEYILPNIAYVGGPAEICYWLQLKPLFEYHHIPFPMLMPRLSALIVGSNTDRIIKKIGYTTTDFFDSSEQLVKRWIKQRAKPEIDLTDSIQTIKQVFSQLTQRAKKQDITLEKHVLAQEHNTLKKIQRIEHKMMQVMKRQHQQTTLQIETVKHDLFPKGKLQERSENFFPFYASNPTLFADMIHMCDPFDFQFHIFRASD